MSEIGLIGKKIGMTRQFYKTGQSVPVTVLKNSLDIPIFLPIKAKLSIIFLSPHLHPMLNQVSLVLQQLQV